MIQSQNNVSKSQAAGIYPANTRLWRILIALIHDPVIVWSLYQLGRIFQADAIFNCRRYLEHVFIALTGSMLWDRDSQRSLMELMPSASDSKHVLTGLMPLAADSQHALTG